jgi:hypothetical protein
MWKQMDKVVPKETDTTVTPKILESYTGRYNFGQGIILFINLNGNQLAAHVSGEPEFPIFPVGNDEFLVKVGGIQIKFIKDSTGSVIGATISRYNRKRDLTKMADEEAVKIPVKAMKRIVGKYSNAENKPFEIILENNTLFIQSEKMKFELFPASETEFFAYEANVRLKFTFDANSQITSSTSFVGGKEYPFKRIP